MDGPASGRMGRRVTIRDVAEDAGVSVAAVSKVLRDAYGVSDAMRSRVRLSMAKLGYRPHTAARGMRGQTYTIGILLADIKNPFFPQLIDGIDDSLADTQYVPNSGTYCVSARLSTASTIALRTHNMCRYSASATGPPRRKKPSSTPWSTGRWTG